MSVENAVRYICEERRIPCHYDYQGGVTMPKMTPEKRAEFEDRKFKHELKNLALEYE